MALEQPKPIAARRTPEAVIEFFSRIRDVPIRSIRLCRIGGFENDPEYEMRFFIGDVIIDRYEVKYRYGTYTIFDMGGK